MLCTLRLRLILSHVVPMLIIVPLTSIILIFIFETRFVFPIIARDLVENALLIARLSGTQPAIWQDPWAAQFTLDLLWSESSVRAMMLTPEGRLLASSDPADKPLLGETIRVPGLKDAQKGKLVKGINENLLKNEEAIDVLVPVMKLDGTIIGFVRMTYRTGTAFEEFLQFKNIILNILFLSLVVGSILGLWLALSINHPIQKVTQAVYALAQGDQREPLVEHGPEEVRLLVRAVNYLVVRLNNLEQARRQLLANLVHELGRPLGALRTAIQALIKGATESPQLLNELAVGMDEEAARLQRLVEDLAHLHDQVLGSMELDCQELKFGEWLPRVLRPWQEAAREKGLTWEVVIPQDLPKVKWDAVRMAQAIDNLISNAINYTSPPGKVTVRVEADQAAIRLTVGDSGPGIAAEEQELIFTPFYRGQQGRRIKQGMGLGLSIARDIVTAHGGKLTVESEPGKGSVFTIYIPR